MKKTIKLTESELKGFIKESVKKMVNEMWSDSEKEKMKSRTENFLDTNPEWDDKNKNLSYKNTIRQEIHRANRHNKKATPISTNWRKAMFAADEIGVEILQLMNHYGFNMMHFGGNKDSEIYNSLSPKEQVYYDRLHNQFLRKRSEALMMLYQAHGLDLRGHMSPSTKDLGVGDDFADTCYGKIYIDKESLMRMGVPIETVSEIIKDYDDYFDNYAPKPIRDRDSYWVAFMKNPHNKRLIKHDYAELDEAITRAIRKYLC